LLLAPFAATELGGLGLPTGTTIGGQFVDQVIGVVVTVGWSFIATVLIVFVVRALVGLRVDLESETEGLDLTAHGERSYNL